MEQKMYVKLYNLSDELILNKQISSYRQDGNELSVSLSEKTFTELTLAINKLYSIEILIEETNLIPLKSVLYRSYRFSVGDLEQKTGENEDGTPIMQKQITVMENSLLFSLV